MISTGLRGVVLSARGGYLTLRTIVGSTHKARLPKSRFKIGDKVYITFDDRDRVASVLLDIGEIEVEPEEREETPDYLEEVPELEPLVFGSFSETDGMTED